MGMLLSACATSTGGPSGTIIPAGIQIIDPWARAATANTDASMGMGGMAKANGASYMMIQNSGAADKLLKAESDAAETVELHTVTNEGGMMQMRPVPSIDVPANGSVELKPGGFHVMLIGLKQELKPGETVTIKLTFEKAGVVQVQAPVRAQ
jgi:copper(I)-binding protein